MTTARLVARQSPVGVSLAVLLVAFVVVIGAGENGFLGPARPRDGGPPRAGPLGCRADRRWARCRRLRGSGVDPRGAQCRPGRRSCRGALSCGRDGQDTCWLDLPAVPMGYFLGRLAVGALIGMGMAVGLFVTGIAIRRRITAVPGIVSRGSHQPGCLRGRLRAVLWWRAVPVVVDAGQM